ncbi:hypothetical protein [Helicobacter sp.]|uniref:hypothetical protein n=1 Tax=Helicobacter sp. TaxID=218 RepID=UPI0019B192EF|nr:hypothetical protein [Helicobacter sp.]MBD5166138.1 hypothetical protein [Helicobacter sp.]
MKAIELDVFDRNGEFLGVKRFYAKNSNTRSINQWIKQYDDKQIVELAFMGNPAPDFQHSSQLYVSQRQGIEHFNFFKICANNLIIASIYFAVRHCILATWLNDRDQFLYPNDKWQEDSIFQNDCLAFTLFHGQNRITSKEGVNHFIPFSEKEVGSKEAFQSHFIHEFIRGRIKQDSQIQDKAEKKGRQKGFTDETFYIQSLIPTKPLEFSAEAQAVFVAGLELWKYYHSQEFKDKEKPYNPNASLYDIKAHFQGFNDKGKMNPPIKAQDSYYKNSIGALNAALLNLAKRITPKVYEYGFLME